MKVVWFLMAWVLSSAMGIVTSLSLFPGQGLLGVYLRAIGIGLIITALTTYWMGRTPTGSRSGLATTTAQHQAEWAMFYQAREMANLPGPMVTAVQQHLGTATGNMLATFPQTRPLRHNDPYSGLYYNQGAAELAGITFRFSPEEQEIAAAEKELREVRIKIEAELAVQQAEKERRREEVAREAARPLEERYKAYQWQEGE